MIIYMFNIDKRFDFEISFLDNTYILFAIQSFFFIPKIVLKCYCFQIVKYLTHYIVQ